MYMMEPEDDDRRVVEAIAVNRCRCREMLAVREQLAPSRMVAPVVGTKENDQATLRQRVRTKKARIHVRRGVARQQMPDEAQKLVTLGWIAIDEDARLTRLRAQRVAELDGGVVDVAIGDDVLTTPP